MKTITQIVWILFFGVFSVNAQQEKGITGLNNWLNNWTEFKPNKVDYGQANQILAGNISVNTKLFKKNVYILQGSVFITNNATLTIEPGTVIIGDYESSASLVITKGATIIAEGLETDPIVFTSNRSSRKAGDWGGIVILGDAPTNKFGNASSVNFDLDTSLTSYGGSNVSSNSGILKFVRIEFAGKKIKGLGNFNALLLAGVGNKTVLENIMISYAAGDSFEIYGGELTLNKLVSFKSSSDDFKFNFGTQCRIDNSLAIRSSYLTSNLGSRCIDVASYDKKEEVDFTKKQTSVIATNLTLINNSENINADIESGLVKEAVYVSQNTSLDIKKTVISGFNPAVLLDNKIEINGENLKKIKFEQMYFNFCKGNIFTEHNLDNEDLENWYGNSAFSNVYSQSDNKETFIDLFNDKKPDFRLRIAKITASNDH
ncbi:MULTISPECIES: hypothetical protein [Flavobacterium]|uniref:T9SS C-terminal target domain-containing protein n=1 Tax=Flavobacterium algoritolerans TaxID=3041254 RepID=A0ABT6V7G0_9FLAO|nr:MULTISPECIES: hypothetical protein [Flavobacterium]MDI5889018.1 hypothetical protein [Flavobacterium yafengii]MDI5894162.1 hypothetical protein [Flavobacterium algoritolerans]